MDGVSLMEPHVDNDPDVSDLESEDSALCLREASDSNDSLFGLNHAPAPGNCVWKQYFVPLPYFVFINTYVEAFIYMFN